MPKATVAVVIINFRTPDLTIDCLRSLVSEVASIPDLRVYVVENGSEDDSLARIAGCIEIEGWDHWCWLLESADNRGFSGGNNFGISAAFRAGGAKYFLLLNSDTLVQPGCLAHCIKIMESDVKIGALSCRVLNSDGSIQNSCRKFPTPLRCLVAAFSLPWRLPNWFGWADCEDLGWDRAAHSRDVEWIGGAFMFLRGDWIAKYKGLDERFFFYGEDLELCHRVWRSGWRCHYNPSMTIVHFGGASSDPSRMALDTRNYHQWRARYLVQDICYGGLAKLFVQVIDVFTALRRLAWWRIARRRDAAELLARSELLGFLVRNWNNWKTRET
jgi:GT2 family glycosyltransferase